MVSNMQVKYPVERQNRNVLFPSSRFVLYCLSPKLIVLDIFQNCSKLSESNTIISDHFCYFVILKIFKKFKFI